MTIDEDLLKAVDRLCRSRHTTRSALIRTALESELNRETVQSEMRHVDAAVAFALNIRAVAG